MTFTPLRANYAMMKRLAFVFFLLLVFSRAVCAVAPAERIVVCVLDSGCDLPGVEGWDFLSDSGDLSDPLGHGTRVYSLLSEAAPEARVYMLKCVDAQERFDEEAVIRALYAAVDDYGADIINMSWTVNADRPALHDAIIYAYESEAVLVAPVGNLSFSTGLGSTTYPAAWDEVIGVGGVNLDDGGEPVSSLFYLQNDAIFVCASAEYDGEKGSSYASPRVAAVIANYFVETLDVTQEDILQMLKDKARDIGESGYDTVYGWGYIRVE